MSRGDRIVTLTPRAASEFGRLAASMGGGAGRLRIAAVRTHCMGGRGFTYRLGLDDTPSEADQVFEDHGLRIAIDPISARHLEGAQVDYVEGLEGTGFRVDNPNALGTCPCGHHDILE